MHTEYLIIGQGISGTMLSWYLKQSGRSFIVLDNGDKNTASRTAAGLINPVTGRRIVQTWMIDQLLPFAFDAYKKLGEELGVNIIHQKNVIDFFPSAQMALAFRDRLAENDHYLSTPDPQDKYISRFNYDFGYGSIAPCYVVDLQSLLSAWRKKLQEEQFLINEDFDISSLIVTDGGINYKEINAQKIIFCDGVQSVRNPFFKNLPFALNKGEALIIEASALPDDVVFKKAMTLVPLKNNLFWVGSSYEWDFVDPHPSAAFLEKTTAYLNHWLKVPFVIKEHLSSIRPATIERRPFVGMHPSQARVGIFNGMGTKGCSLAPWFANTFVNHLTKNDALSPEVNVDRFSRLLKLQ
jgi:glycine/D-amino acid oxidase-like deaminating enzyme